MAESTSVTVTILTGEEAQRRRAINVAERRLVRPCDTCDSNGWQGALGFPGCSVPCLDCNADGSFDPLAPVD